jgi:hypothetical protein
LRGSGRAATEYMSPLWKMLYQPSEKCPSESLPNIAARRSFQRLVEEYLALSAAADVDLPALEVNLPLAHGFSLCSYATAPPA